jgi:hypothetical protein
MKAILDKFGVDETFTKQRITKPKQDEWNSIKNNIPLKEDYNFMADVLHLPTDKKGFKYLFVIVDLATDDFDMEPMKLLDQDTTLAALKNCLKRKYIKIDKNTYTVTTDGAQEFAGKFHQWLWDKNIFHRTGLGYRHEQHANVESLNKQLGRVFNGYMNAKEEATGKVYREWTDIVAKLRIDLNKFRKKILPKDPVYKTVDLTEEKKAQIKDKKTGEVTDITYYDKVKPPKFKVGDIVHRILQVPKNALGKNQPTTNFRAGDYYLEKEGRQITQILYMSDKPLYRYLLAGIKKASFTDNELRKI